MKIAIGRAVTTPLGGGYVANHLVELPDGRIVEDHGVKVYAAFPALYGVKVKGITDPVIISQDNVTPL